MRTLDQFTDADVARLEQLCAALDANLIAFTYSAEGCKLMTTATAEAALAQTHGGKTRALVAAKRSAKAHDRTVPRSLADALADPALVAYSAAS